MSWFSESRGDALIEQGEEVDRALYPERDAEVGSAHGTVGLGRWETDPWA